LGGRRALTAWRTTCKWRQSSPLSRTPRGCRCCKYGLLDKNYGYSFPHHIPHNNMKAIIS
jgi:hypothetical protein